MNKIYIAKLQIPTQSFGNSNKTSPNYSLWFLSHVSQILQLVISDFNANTNIFYWQSGVWKESCEIMEKFFISHCMKGNYCIKLFHNASSDEKFLCWDAKRHWKLLHHHFGVEFYSATVLAFEIINSKEKGWKMIIFWHIHDEQVFSFPLIFYSLPPK